ncbi:FAD binding domain-containing protein [Bacteroidota bacterium]
MLGFDVISPETVEELLNEIENNKDNNFRFGAGYTDLILELKKQSGPKINIINLSKINDSSFTSIEKTNKNISIGALATAAEIVKNEEIQNLFPVLHKAADTLASRQIRQVATVGGNICTASPAGDIATALVALEAVCEILSTKNEIREVPIREYFTGVRKTVLNKDEVLRSIVIPVSESHKKIFSDFIKIGTRKSMECSIVSLAFHLNLDKDDKILNAGIAIGSSAPTIKFTQSACDFLIGKRLNGFNSKDKEDFAGKVLEYASPISDVRGSEWYRKQVLSNISKSIFEVD